MNRIPIYFQNGNGIRARSAGMGDDSIEVMARAIADKIVNAMLPSLTPIVQKASEAAEPTIRTVIREEVMPKVGMYSVVGLAAVAAVAALIGIAVSRKK